MAITKRVSEIAREDAGLTKIAHSPSHPIAAQVMREFGVSVAEMNAAYAEALKEAFKTT